MEVREAQRIAMIRAVIFDFDGTLAPLSLNFDHMRAEIEAIAGQYVSE